MTFRRFSAAVALASTVFVARGALGAFTIGNPGTNSTTAVGQNFSPSAEPTPPQSLAATDVVQLTSFTFAKGFNANGNVATRLAVLPGAYYDTNGADGTFVPTIADVTGISTNMLDTTGAVAAGTALTFSFDNLPLLYGSNYAVAFVTVGPGDALSFIPVNVHYADYTEVAPGNFDPVTNYGGAGNFNRVALFADFDGDGFFQADNETADLNFTATFAVPEPAGAGAALMAAGVLLARRRRRA